MKYLLAISVVANAGWLSDWCKQQLVGDDPHPFAEYSTSELFEMHELSKDHRVLSEIVYRLRFKLMTEKEVEMFWRKFGPK